MLYSNNQTRQNNSISLHSLFPEQCCEELWWTDHCTEDLHPQTKILYNENTKGWRNFQEDFLNQFCIHILSTLSQLLVYKVSSWENFLNSYLQDNDNKLKGALQLSTHCKREDNCHGCCISLFLSAQGETEYLVNRAIANLHSPICVLSCVNMTCSKILTTLYYCRISQMIYTLMSEGGIGWQFSVMDDALW